MYRQYVRDDGNDSGRRNAASALERRTCARPGRSRAGGAIVATAQERSATEVDSPGITDLKLTATKLGCRLQNILILRRSETMSTVAEKREITPAELLVMPDAVSYE